MDRTWFNLSQELGFIVGIDRICTINHLVFLYGFHHSRHLIQSVTTIQIVFEVDYIYMNDHIVVLSGFHHRW